MPDSEKLAEEFLEISSHQRLGIVLYLAEKKARMSTLAKELDATSSEIHRNLNRMIKAKIISKDVDGFYNLTTYGKVIRNQIGAWDLFASHKKYFEKHGLASLDQKFLQRIGAMANSEYIKGFVKIQEQWKNINKNSKKYIHNILYEVPYEDDVIKTISKIVKSGVKIRSIFLESAILSRDRKPVVKKYGLDDMIKKELIQRRITKDLKVMVVLNEKQACVMFPKLDGEIDVSEGLYSDDEDFHEWCVDYFNSCWEKSLPFQEAKLEKNQA